MKTIKVSALALFASLAAPAFAADQADPVAVVQKYLAAFSAGDKAAAAALCTPDAVIVDDFPPYVWKGPNACATWWDALGAYNASQGIGAPETIGTAGAPWRSVVTGEQAYVVVPMSYHYTQHGKPVLEDGSTWTLAMTKTPSGWLITGWAWGQH